MQASRLLPVLLSLAGCTPAPAPIPPAPTVAVQASAAPSPPVAPADGSACHFAQGVAPRDPGRVCDPCAHGGPFHLEQSGFLSGNMTLDVRADGAATWTKQELRPGTSPKTWHATLSPDQLASLEQAMTKGHVCDQRSARPGIPDEATVQLALCFPTTRCEVMLWEGEWGDRPGAKAALAVVDGVINDVVKRGAPPSP